MYVVVGRKNKDSIGVLDTDSMKAFKTDLESARGRLNASGAVLKDGIDTKYVFAFNKGDKHLYNNIRVYCNSLNIDDSYYSHDSSIDFDNYIESMKLISPMAYLMCYGILVKNLKFDKFDVIFDNNSYNVMQSDYESIILFCLYSLYNKVGVSVLYTSENISPDFSYINSHIECFEYRNQVYFCDSVCTVIVSNKVLKEISGVAKRLVKNVKYETMKSGMKSSIASDDVFVGSGKRVTIKDSKRYTFKDTLYINELIIDMDKKAKLIFEDGCKLFVHRFIYNGNKKVLSKLHKYFVLNSLSLYSVNKDAFSFDFYFKNFIRGNGQSVLAIPDYTDEDWRDLVIRSMGDRLYELVQNKEDLSEDDIGILKTIYLSLFDNGCTSEEILNITHLMDYAVADKEDFIAFYKDKDTHKLLSGTTVYKFFVGACKDKYVYIDNRIERYDRIFKAIVRQYNEMVKVARLTGCKVDADHSHIFSVSYKSSLPSENNIILTSMDNLETVELLERTSKTINNYVKSRYNVSFIYTLKQYFNNVDNIKLCIVRIKAGRGAKLSNETVQEMYNYVKSFNLSIEFSYSIISDYKLS